jgi:uncharacterized membrane protein
MANEEAIADTDASPARPIVHAIGPGDLRDALAKGLADFEAMPTHLVFLCLIYPIVMLIAARVSAGYEVLPLVFPMLAGYALVGPVVATSMYELSRRREQGLDTARRHAFDVLQFPSIWAIGRLSVLLMTIYLAWLGTAWAIYDLIFGSAVPESIVEFALQVFTTPSGWTLIFVGCAAGFIFATVTFALSVVSFPMLVDRDVGVTTALQTSVRAVLASPITMGMWAFIVALVRRPRRRPAGARTRDLASVSQDCGAQRSHC